MERTIPGMRHVVDWRAAVLAGLLGGLVFLITNMVLTGIVLGTPWVVTQIAASFVLGVTTSNPAPAIWPAGGEMGRLSI